MKIDDDDDEMQNTTNFCFFSILFNIFFKPRVIESADRDPADKAGLLRNKNF
jgi:hypothetical protein